MLAWKVDVGYIPNTSYTPAPTLNISDIIFTDRDRYFVLPTGTPSEYKVVRPVEDLVAAYEKIQETLGADVSAIYLMARRGISETGAPVYANFNSAFPSAMKMYPNLWDYAKSLNATTEFEWVYYFKQFDAFLIEGYFYTNDNGVLTRKVQIGSEAMTTLYYYGWNIPAASICYFDNSVEVNQTTLTSNNYYNIGISAYDNGTAQLTYYNYPELTKLFSLLFETGGYQEPDFDIPGDGPYDPGGDSDEGDLPPGTFDDTSDPIPDSPLPTISAADTGFTRIYNPTLSQVQALARYLWTEPSLIDTIWNHIKQFFEDPMQAIIGFNLVPCKVPDGGTRSFALMFIDTGVEMTSAASQFVDVDCGTYKLERYYGSALDQNPYTKVSCFLPYIGTVHLNTDEVMGTTLQVKYRIDIVSGTCVAKILVDGSVLYQYSGHCAITIPISSADFSSYVSAAITVGSAIAGLAVGAAAGGAAAVGSEVVQSTGAVVASDALGAAQTQLAAQGGVPSTIGQHEFAAQQLAYMAANPPPGAGAGTQASFSGLNPESIVNTVGQVMGGKMQVEHSGSFSGNSGYLGVRRPFLIIERPNMCLPSTYGQLNGYPSMITLNLGECSGFTRVQQVRLTGCTATNPEQSEILQFLKSGVVL